MNNRDKMHCSQTRNMPGNARIARHRRAGSSYPSSQGCQRVTEHELCGRRLFPIMEGQMFPLSESSFRQWKHLAFHYRKHFSVQSDQSIRGTRHARSGFPILVVQDSICRPLLRRDPAIRLPPIQLAIRQSPVLKRRPARFFVCAAARQIDRERRPIGRCNV
jgi:hypothetical protein